MTGAGPTFWILAVLLTVSAVGVVTLRNVVHAALCLAFALIMAGGLYLNLDADLLAGFQVLIYVGAVITLLLIAIMVISNIADRPPTHARASLGWPLVVAAISALTLWVVIAGTAWPANPVLAHRQVDHERQALGLSLALLGPYLLAFEVASVLLLVALVGAIVLAQHTRALEQARREARDA